MGTGAKWAIGIIVLLIIFAPATVGKIIDTGTNTVTTAVNNRNCGG